MNELWTFNGQALTVYGKCAVESVLEGVGMPKLRGSDLQLPFQHGKRWIKKKFDRRTVVLSMWIIGKSRTELDERIDQFLKAIGPLGQHTLVRTLSNGETRQAEAELSSEISFVRKSPGYAKFALEFELADPFFYGAAKVTETKTISAGVTTWTHVNAGSAPATGMVITLSGPLSNPVIRNQNNSVWVQVVGEILSGQTLVLDTKYFKCTRGTENMISLVRHGGDAYWMVLDAGNNSLKLESNTTGGSVKIEYYPAYY